jgi:chromatin segregation and condensation protein Rec8/ScpA/Scc1 (kleisin family)
MDFRRHPDRDTMSLQLCPPELEGDPAELLRAAIDGAVRLEDVTLSDVFARARAHAQSQHPVNLEDLGELIAASARLLLLKSQSLLAQPAEQEEAAPCPPASDAWPARAELSSRLRALEGRESLVPRVPPVHIERPVAPHSPHVLLRAWHDTAARRDVDPLPVVVPTFVRLETAVSGAIRRLKRSIRLPFRRLVAGTGRSELVIHFLAVLELVRQRRATAEQDALFGEITIEYRDDERDAAARAG